MLGGAFNSRLNLSLREVHGFTYGANSAKFTKPAIRTVDIRDPEQCVVTPTTDSSIAILDCGDPGHPLDATREHSEAAFAKRTETLSLPLQFADSGA